MFTGDHVYSFDDGVLVEKKILTRHQIVFAFAMYENKIPYYFLLSMLLSRLNIFFLPPSNDGSENRSMFDETKIWFPYGNSHINKKSRDVNRKLEARQCNSDGVLFKRNEILMSWEALKKPFTLSSMSSFQIKKKTNLIKW